jgi:hypothetical protein
MDLLVLKSILALLEKSGMPILIVVNVLKLLIGTVSNVKHYLNVLEVKSLIVIIYALVLKAMYGHRIYVSTHLVMEVKFGLDLNVYAQQV